MALRSQSLAVAALLACSLCLSHCARPPPPAVTPAVTVTKAAAAATQTAAAAAAAAAAAEEDVASNWLCTPGSGAMCKELPDNVFQVSNYKVYRGGACLLLLTHLSSAIPTEVEGVPRVYQGCSRCPTTKCTEEVRSFTLEPLSLLPSL